MLSEPRRVDDVAVSIVDGPLPSCDEECELPGEDGLSLLGLSDPLWLLESPEWSPGASEPSELLWLLFGPSPSAPSDPFERRDPDGEPGSASPSPDPP
ncbi:hypothetical protein [Amycolatopsis sp. NPDC000740]|uniref:hypothetical protein n=1 Tax=Amycolatopsis sp. NPDC000740 TaxID=3154269 RepID=UPI00332C4C54